MNPPKPCPCCLANRLVRAPRLLNRFSVCRACGFMMRSEQTVVNTNQVAAHYETVDPHRKVAGSKQSFFRHALGAMKQPPGSVHCLLDVGCGYGYFLEMASEKGWQVAGVEIARDAAEAAGRSVGKQNVHHGTLASAGFANHSFDAVTLWDVLVFAPEPHKDLDETFRVLKPGGILGLRVRNITFQRWLHRLYFPLQPILSTFGVRNPYVFHPRNFSRKALWRLLDRIGYANIQIGNSPLTRGNPYGTARWEGAVGRIKQLMQALANVVYRLSGGRWTVGPSLLVWAEKPAEENKKAHTG